MIGMNVVCEDFWMIISSANMQPLSSTTDNKDIIYVHKLFTPNIIKHMNSIT